MRTAARTAVPLFAVAVLATACAQTKSFTNEAFEARSAERSTVLLMPPDVQLSELKASGIEEPRADWTQTARRNVRQALEDVLAKHQDVLRDYRPVDDPVSVYQDKHLQLVKLHERVGQSVLLHKYKRPFALPTKRDEFDWTLGEGIRRLRGDYDADYALFITFRDSFSSGGRVALIITAALFGVAVPGGKQVGFASLVDLETGRIAWFNVMQSGTGDLREPKRAFEATSAVLDEVPL